MTKLYQLGLEFFPKGWNCFQNIYKVLLLIINFIPAVKHESSILHLLSVPFVFTLPLTHAPLKGCTLNDECIYIFFLYFVCAASVSGHK